MKYLIILKIMILVLLGCLWLLYKWYKQEQQEQDERILVLEKRIQEQYEDFSDTINDYKDKIINLNIEQSDLEKRIQKLERKKKSDNNE